MHQLAAMEQKEEKEEVEAKNSNIPKVISGTKYYTVRGSIYIARLSPFPQHREDMCVSIHAYVYISRLSSPSDLSCIARYTRCT